MIQESTLFQAKKLLQSIQAPAYQKHTIKRKDDDKPMKIVRKLDMYWTKKEIETKAPKVYYAMLRDLSHDERKPKYQTHEQAIRGILINQRKDQPEIREMFKGYI